MFRAADDGRRIAFQRADDGRIDAFAGSYGHTIFERANPIDAPVTLLITIGLLALTSIGVLLCAWRRSARRTRRWTTTTRWRRSMRISSWPRISWC